MYKEIYYIKNGKPSLIKEDESYDESVFTNVQPPSELYQPIYFKDGKWIGTPYEEWLKQQVEVETPKQDTEVHKDQIIAELSLELIRTQEELNDVRKDISDLTMQLLGGNANA